MALTPVKKRASSGNAAAKSNSGSAASAFDAIVAAKKKETGIMDEVFGEGANPEFSVDVPEASPKSERTTTAFAKNVQNRAELQDEPTPQGVERIEARPQLPAKVNLDFREVLDNITSLDDKYKVLWKQIYDHAIADRNNAYVIWYDLFQMVIGDEERHFKHGAILAKYMERFEKANGQLLKLAELLDKVRSEEEEKDAPSGGNLYDEWERDAKK